MNATTRIVPPQRQRQRGEHARAHQRAQVRLPVGSLVPIGLDRHHHPGQGVPILEAGAVQVPHRSPGGA